MKITALYSIIIFLTLKQCSEIYTLDILGVFPYQGKSHFYLFELYLKELAKKGHNVTVISYFPQNKPLKNYYDISLAGKSIIFENIAPFQEISVVIKVLVGLGMAYIASDNCYILLEDEEVQDLWKSKRKFDVVAVEQFNGDCALGLAHKLDAPVVGLTSHILMPYHYERFGISYNPSYVPFFFLHGGTKPTFLQRLERTIYHLYFKLIFKLTQHYEHQILSKYFDDVPPLEDLARDIKFMLVYDNFMLTRSNIFPSNIIEVGGYHVGNPKPLPDQILKYIEESEHGVIYISFGSMLRTASIPKDKLQAIVDALAELPQRVIWKWEAKSIPGNPKNILISKWLPQKDILAHPKVLAFYSHCGMLGTTEAIHHGVPIVGMPMFADQPANAAAIEESGYGVKILVEDLTKENLLNKFKTVLDPKFRANVKLLSQAWHDRPKSAIETAVYWTEYAAKYRNYTFRSAAADVPVYQYLYLDIILISIVTLIIISYIIIFIYRVCIKDKSTKGVPKKKSKKYD